MVNEPPPAECKRILNIPFKFGSGSFVCHNFFFFLNFFTIRNAEDWNVFFFQEEISIESKPNQKEKKPKSKNLLHILFKDQHLINLKKEQQQNLNLSSPEQNYVAIKAKAKQTSMINANTFILNAKFIIQFNSLIIMMMIIKTKQILKKSTMENE